MLWGRASKQQRTVIACALDAHGAELNIRLAKHDYPYNGAESPAQEITDKKKPNMLIFRKTRERTLRTTLD